MNERVVPAMAQGGEVILQKQIAIAERYPAIRACFTDQVIFLDGGSATLPVPNLATLTMEQADVLVARLQEG